MGPVKAGKRVSPQMRRKGLRHRDTEDTKFLPRIDEMHAKGCHEGSVEGQLLMIYRLAIYHELPTRRGERVKRRAVDSMRSTERPLRHVNQCAQGRIDGLLVREILGHVRG